MARLLKVFLCFTSTQYENSLLLNMANLYFLRENGHPVWDMFANDLIAFSEEPGELSFSLLQRFQRKDTLRFDIEHLNEKFKLISQYYSVTKDFANELLNDGFANYFNLLTIDPDSAEVATLANHFNDVLDKMQDGSWVYYRPHKKSRKKNKSEAEVAHDAETSKMREGKGECYTQATGCGR